MARIDLDHLSTEYVRVAVSAREAGAVVDPTDGDTWLAFISRDDVDGGPVSGDWLVGSWETDGSQFYARVMVGPDGGAISLAPGYYRIWVKWEVAPETPVKSIGTLYVY